MAYLTAKGCKKQDLRVLAQELGVKISDYFIIAKIVDAIVKSPSFNEEFTKGLLLSIIDDRLEREEHQNKEREYELEKLKLE